MIWARAGANLAGGDNLNQPAGWECVASGGSMSIASAVCLDVGA